MAVAFLAVLMLVVMLVTVAVGIVAFLFIMMVVSAAALAVFVVVLVLVVMVVVGTETSVLVDEVRKAVVMMFVALTVRVIALLAVVVMVMVMLVTLAVRVVAFLSVLVDVVVLVTVALGIVAFVVIVVLVTVAVGVIALLAVVVMMVMVLEGLPVDGVIESGIVDGMEHLVGELMLVDIQDGAHEVEFHFVGTVHGTVVLDTVVHVDEVEGDPLAAVDIDGCLDVSQEASGLALYELSDGHEGIGEPLLRIGVEVEDAAGESSCASACLFH